MADVIGLWNQIFEGFRGLSDFYEKTGSQLEPAIRVNLKTGVTTVDGDAVRSAAKQFLSVDLEDQVSRMVSGLQLGFAVRDHQIVAPWIAFIDPELRSQLDIAAWRSFGVKPDSRPGALLDTLDDLYPHVPDQVLDPGNLRQLVRASQFADFRAKSFEALQAGALVALRRQDPDSGGPDERQGGGYTGWGGGYTGWGGLGPVISSGATPLSPADALKAADCFVGAQWGWAYGSILSICMDKACADTLEAVLMTGAGGEFINLVAAAIKSGVSAAVAGAGGWVSVALMLSAIYWGSMIHTNKTAMGVCLKVPMPWTFGAIGPGWAVGRR